MNNSQIEQTANKSVAFSGKLRLQIEEKAAELGLTFDEFVKAQMSLQLNNQGDLKWI